MKKNKIKTYSLQPVDGEALLNYKGRLSADDLYMQVYDVDNNNSELVNCKDESELEGTIFNGDCLSVCAYLKDKNKTVDLVYIDPPFASNANYSKKILLRQKKAKFKDKNLNRSESSIGEEIMYGDIWSKEDYLNWLYIRLIAIKEVMSDNACIYVHLDWHIGHYVKILLDEIFGEENFINEIIWQYYMGGKGDKEFAKKHDTIYLYAKNKKDYVFNKSMVKRYLSYIPSLGDDSKAGSQNNIESNGVDEIGHYSIVACPDVWEISGVFNMSGEYTSYNTQKPEALLKRIIETSSNAGMTVADFFGGSGVTAKVAHDLGRKFITCDVGINAIQTMRDRLKAAGAKFEILDIRDGLDLFRNPSQTMNQLFNLCSGKKRNNDSEYSNLWDGEIPYNKLMMHTKIIDNRKMLDENYLDYLITEISQDNINEPNSEYLILYVFKDENLSQETVDRKLKNLGLSFKINLVSIESILKERQNQLNYPDSANVMIKKEGNKYIVKILNYFSTYLKRKIDLENERRTKKTVDTEIKISESGYELIEFISFDITLDNRWISYIEEKAEPNTQIKGEYELPTDKFRLKIRNIAGDEIIINSEECKHEQ